MYGQRADLRSAEHLFTCIHSSSRHGDVVFVQTQQRSNATFQALNETVPLLRDTRKQKRRKTHQVQFRIVCTCTADSKLAMLACM